MRCYLDIVFYPELTVLLFFLECIDKNTMNYQIRYSKVKKSPLMYMDKTEVSWDVGYYWKYFGAC